MLIRQIDHAAIYVRDLATSLTWYHDNLEFPIEYHGPLGRGLFGAFLRVGDTLLNVLEDASGRDLSQQHIGFSVEDVDRVWKQLLKKGVVFDFDAPRVLPQGYIAGQRYINFSDPNGIRLELVERRPEYYRETSHPNVR